MNTVVIGNFDGVHTGHQALLAEAAKNQRLVVLTFWPHPVSVLRPGSEPQLLTDLDTRIDMLRQAGADEVRVVHFDERIAQLSPQEFIERFVLPLAPDRVLVGENFRFGRQAVGNVDTLRQLGEDRFEVVGLSLAMLDDVVTCSTLIRKALADGDVALAAQHLGRPFCCCGVVEMGDQRGRGLGFPTANLSVPPGLAMPADGVYAGWVRHNGRDYPAAISVGTNPTFDGLDRRVESYVLDETDLTWYGDRIHVGFVARLRGQLRFGAVAELIEQMHFDVAAARSALGIANNK
ncbi:MAG: bifunctional riboflavin kinase/FMN adenylyltransferase [Arachnia propionica]|nr:MAG: bifunctional riboflavin kinase/FMN adenylyltransferase [Arachnia propionica]